ncbi:MAG: YscQ/HrcQ family type III secretion apparatus protein [Sulfitobacter sp.]|nr:YscQ/HrcQ family type III secretion apparatus protein [Sulfitobacter sp.]
MTTTRPAEFPIYSRQRIRLQNLLATRNPGFHLQLNGKSTYLFLRQTPSRTVSTDAFALKSQGSNLWLEIDAHTFGQLCAPWTGNEPLEDLPAQLREAVRSAALTPLLEGLNACCGIETRLARDTSPGQGQASHTQCLGLWNMPAAGVVPLVTIHLDDAATALLIAGLDHTPPAASLQDWSRLPLDATVEIGQTDLRMLELKALEPGDLILLPPGAPAYENELIVRHRRRPIATAHLDGHTLTVDRLLESVMAGNTAPNTQETLPGGLDPESVEVRLTFDLGQLSISLGDLQQIQPGYNFELDMPAMASVRIRAGDQVIGRGELIQIEERLGVRVTELFAPTNE